MELVRRTSYSRVPNCSNGMEIYRLLSIDRPAAAVVAALTAAEQKCIFAEKEENT